MGGGSPQKMGVTPPNIHIICQFGAVPQKWGRLSQMKSEIYKWGGPPKKWGDPPKYYSKFVNLGGSPPNLGGPPQIEPYKPHTRLCHITSLNMIGTELTEKLSAKSCSKLSMEI